MNLPPRRHASSLWIATVATLAAVPASKGLGNETAAQRSGRVTAGVRAAFPKARLPNGNTRNADLAKGLVSDLGLKYGPDGTLDDADGRAAVTALVEFLAARKPGQNSESDWDDVAAYDLVDALRPGFTARVAVARGAMRDGNTPRGGVGLRLLDSGLFKDAAKATTLTRDLAESFRQAADGPASPRAADGAFWQWLFRYYPTQTYAALAAVVITADVPETRPTTGPVAKDGLADLDAAERVGYDLETQDWTTDPVRGRVAAQVASLAASRYWFARAYAARCMGLAPTRTDDFPLRDDGRLAALEKDAVPVVREIGRRARNGEIPSTR